MLNCTNLTCLLNHGEARHRNDETNHIWAHVATSVVTFFTFPDYCVSKISCAKSQYTAVPVRVRHLRTFLPQLLLSFFKLQLAIKTGNGAHKFVINQLQKRKRFSNRLFAFFLYVCYTILPAFWRD